MEIVGSYKIEFDRTECIGCSTCTAFYPSHWELLEDGFAHLKNSSKTGNKEFIFLNDPDCNIDAANSCPVLCIYIYKDGKRIV